jgi:flagellar hook-associated protein 2
MADTNIPGIKSKYDTERLIENLMKLERVPKERAEKEVKTLETQKTVWQDVGRRIGTLRESARALYSFQNPFSERIAISGDEAVLTANAKREASEQVRTFIVKQTAQADRFLSKPLPENYRVPAGDYVFAIGKEEISVPFRGGTVKEFSEAVARRGKDKISISSISVEPKTRSIIFESLLTGSENRLIFKKDAEKFALETNTVARVDDGERKIPLQNALIKTSNAERAQVVDGVLRVAAGGDAVIPVSPGIRVKGELTLEAEISAETKNEKTPTEDAAPTGPAIPSTGSISYGGIIVESDPSSVPLPKYEKPPIPERVDNPNVVKLVFSDGTSAIVPPVRDDAGFERATYKLSDYLPASGSAKDLVAVELTNKNTHRDVSIRSLRVFDPQAMGGFKPLTPIAQASDAIVLMDGIEVKRTKNEIEDLIPGVTVSVRGTSDKPVKLTIEPDRKTAKEAIIGVVGNYNRLVAEINILTRTDDQIIKELAYLTPDEQKSMQERLGSLQGDVTLNQLKTSLQRTSGAPYQTSEDKGLVLLTQIGVSTDSRKPGSISGVDASRLRGYLEIDEKALDRVLQDKMVAVKELFGSDSDGDLLVDQGFAYSVDSITKPFVETGGLIQLKTGTIDTKVATEKRRIETLDRQLVAKESDLKRKYGLMESSLNSMERTSSSIDQFSSGGK